jgi:hypothetical protein
MGNYIEGRNPYSLARPSAWWLQLLHDYDPLLVVMPSVKDCVYRLCRRVPRNQRLGNLVKHLHTHPDTVQMINHGLVPVSTLTTWAIQSDKIIRDLMARDTHRAGGADKTVELLEQADLRRARALDRQQAADLDARSGEAFRSMQFRNGSAVALSGVGRSATRVDSLDHNPVISPRSGSSRRPTQISLTDLL